MATSLRDASPLAERIGPKVLRAFASYAWATQEDQASIGSIVEELRLRGFATFRDREGLAHADDLEARIRKEIARSAVVVPYLTPDSLKSDPVVALEFATARTLHEEHGRPVLMPIVRNLGTDRAEITRTTWARLRYDFGSRWTRLPAAGSGPLSVDDAASHAGDALRAALAAGEGPDLGQWELRVATRGDRPSPCQLTVDATDLVGGDTSRPGDRQTWSRVFRGICDLKKTLNEHGARRGIRIEPTCHLTGAFAAGWVFRRTTGWKVTVLGQDGVECEASDLRSHDALLIGPRVNGVFAAAGGTLVVSVDLVPRDIAMPVAQAQPEPPRAHLPVRRTATAQSIPCEELGAMAAMTADAIKAQCAEIHPDQVALYLATPAAFAVLLGAELGALGCPIMLHEYDGTSYIESLEVPA